jgi:membrane-associated phospholipid phosphatase
MRKASSWWKWLSPEAVILLLVPTATLMIVLALGMLNRPAIGKNFWLTLIYAEFFGSEVLHALFFIGLGYFAFSAVAYFWQRRRLKQGKPGKSPESVQRCVERFQVAKDFARLAMMYAYGLIAAVATFNALCLRKPETVAWADDFLMRADHRIFGTFVPFEMHNQALWNWLAVPMLACYLKLTLILSLVIVALFIFRADRFRQFILAFVAIMFLAMPGWAALPATTPSEAYRTVKLRKDIPYDIAIEIAEPIVHLDDMIVNLLERLERVQSNPVTGRYFITSFPSPHVAWGVIIVWFGIELYQKSIVLLLPWGLLNCIGAIYSLQHYAVDAVAGIVVAIAAVYLVRGLVALEAGHGIDAPRGYGLSKSMQQDLADLGRWIWPSAKGKPGRARKLGAHKNKKPADSA